MFQFQRGFFYSLRRTSQVVVLKVSIYSLEEDYSRGQLIQLVQFVQLIQFISFNSFKPIIRGGYPNYKQINSSFEKDDILIIFLHCPEGDLSGHKLEIHRSNVPQIFEGGTRI